MGRRNIGLLSLAKYGFLTSEQAIEGGDCYLNPAYGVVDT